MAGRRMALHFGKLPEMPGRPRQLCQRARSRHSIPRPISSSKETRLSGNGKIMMDPDTVEAEEETKKTGNMTPICLFHQNFWSRQWQGAEASALGRRLSVLLPASYVFPGQQRTHSAGQPVAGFRRSWRAKLQGSGKMISFFFTRQLYTNIPSSWHPTSE